MRTKSLILAAALGLASVASTYAQTYSVNAVGFVNLTVVPGYSILANPLSATDNSVAALIPTVPAGSAVYKFVNGQYVINSFVRGRWQDPTMTLAPGEGFFFNNNQADPLTLTFVGEVMQGNLSLSIIPGYSIISSQVPQSIPLSSADPAVTTTMGFPAENGDAVYFFRGGQYEIHTFARGSWKPSDPVPNIGEGWFVNKVNGGTWTRQFSVNN